MGQTVNLLVYNYNINSIRKDNNDNPTIRAAS